MSQQEGAIMHWSKAGDSLTPGQEPVLAPGVRGVAFDMFDGIYIPLVVAENPGRGDVSRFLDSLPLERRIVFPNVTSAKLRGMLERRGFSACWDAEGECEILERLAKKG